MTAPREPLDIAAVRARCEETLRAWSYRCDGSDNVPCGCSDCDLTRANIAALDELTALRAKVAAIDTVLEDAPEALVAMQGCLSGSMLAATAPNHDDVPLGDMVEVLEYVHGLAAKVAELEHDAARLDWLDSLVTIDTPRVELEYFYLDASKRRGNYVSLSRFVDYERTSDGTWGFGDSLRAAIDAAKAGDV